MSATEFVYTTYIKTTPELLWQALTEPSFTRRYWGVTFESDWQPGSTMSWEQFGVTITDPEQVVIASDPYSRLAYSWHTVTPEFTTAAGIDEQTRVALAAESRSTVTFDIVQLKGMVKLTVTHNGFDAGSTMLAGISDGWPAILAGLKTLLETGESLPEPAVP